MPARYCPSEPLARCRAVLFALALFVAGPAAAAPDEAALGERVAALKAEIGVNAVLVGIDRGEGAPLFLAAGESLPGEPARSAMTARIGAMSITAITTILLQLADEGVVSLDDPLERHLPGYPSGDEVTLRMLANATSGYADYESDPAFVDAFYADPFQVFERAALISMALDRGMQFQPGTDFGYSHAGFAILAEALEAASARPLETLIEERIIAPLGLEHTFQMEGAALPEPVLQAYTTERGFFENATFWSPSWTLETGVLSAAMPDLLRLARAFGTGELLSEAAFAEMIAPTTAGMGRFDEGTWYGLGIGVRPPLVFQTFSFGGYAGAVSHDREHDLTVAVVVTQGRTSDAVINHAMPVMEALRAMLLP